MDDMKEVGVKLMMKSQFMVALILAIAPSIVTSLIEGAGEWSNSRNYKKSRALDAIYSFRFNIGNQMNQPSSNYYKNVSQLTNHQMQLMVIYLNQWSVYINSHIASQKVVRDAVGYELVLCLLILLPTANELKATHNLNDYFTLVNKYYGRNSIIKLQGGNYMRLKFTK